LQAKYNLQSLLPPLNDSTLRLLTPYTQFTFFQLPSTIKMRFTIIAASLVAAVAAQYGAPAEESCSAVVTVTVTEYVYPHPPIHQSNTVILTTPLRTLAHTPVAPSMSSAYYPTTTPMAATSAPVMGGTGVPMVPDASSVGTGYPMVPMPSGTAAPSGNMTVPPTPEFTGAASGFKVGGALAGVGAVVALLL
jgi:hypothetical protein